MHIHLIGVAGTGMGSLAGLLREGGHRVTGSDLAFHPPMGPALRSWGVECRQGYSAAHIDPRTDLVVVGNVCRSNNPEARAAIDGGFETTHIAGALQRFALVDSVPLVVGGTHGKTTTSTLLAWLLESAGQRPGFFIGGIAENFGRGFRLPHARGPMVLEGDEYDTAFFEKTAKFLHYRAKHAIITSIEHDHVDIYPSENEYLDAFQRFAGALPADAVLIANLDDDRVRQVAQAATCRLHWYSLNNPEADFSVSDREPFPHRFTVLHRGKPRTRVDLPLIGIHNAGNCLAAMALAHVAQGADWQVMTDGLREFRGSKRRQQLLGTPAGVRIYDDFAHHPTAVSETLVALRERHPDGRLLVAFEPRSATACRRMHQQRYAEAFDSADAVFLAPIGRPELEPELRLDTDELARALSNRGVRAVACGSIPEVQTRLIGMARPGDSIALLSNGAFGGIHAQLLTALAESH